MLLLHRKTDTKLNDKSFQEPKLNDYPQYSYPWEVLDYVRVLALRDIKGEIREVINYLSMRVESFIT